MATESQINANRENAKLSSGPQTVEGKAKSSRSNTKFGLFAISNCVQPEEKENYENFCSTLWATLAPADPVEEVTAAEFIRNAWRLRRCAITEETLGEIVARFQASQSKTRNTDHPAADPMIYPAYLPTENAIDRARTSAQSGMSRAKADLDKMQAARKAQPSPVLQVEPNPDPVATEIPEREKPAPTIRTQSKPVPHPTPSLPSANPSAPPPSETLWTLRPATQRHPIELHRRSGLLFRLAGTNALQFDATPVSNCEYLTRAPAGHEATGAGAPIM